MIYRFLLYHPLISSSNRRREVTGPEILSYGDDEASADDDVINQIMSDMTVVYTS